MYGFFAEWNRNLIFAVAAVIPSWTLAVVMAWTREYVQQLLPSCLGHFMQQSATGTVHPKTFLQIEQVEQVIVTSTKEGKIHSSLAASKADRMDQH